jgi:hypothetical protein
METKVTPVAVGGFGVDFEIDMNFLLLNVVKRVRNRTTRFRCFFCSTDDYGI